MDMNRAVAIAATADGAELRRAYAAGVARGATNTWCAAEEERTYGTLRLLTLAMLRLPDLFLYAHIVEVLAGDAQAAFRRWRWARSMLRPRAR